jgi:hypothetical protein
MVDNLPMNQSSTDLMSILMIQPISMINLSLLLVLNLYLINADRIMINRDNQNWSEGYKYRKCLVQSLLQPIRERGVCQ